MVREKTVVDKLDNNPAHEAITMSQSEKSERPASAPNPVPPPTLPYASEASDEDARPPLYISGFGPMNQSTPDVATGSTPVTRHDD